MTFLRTARAPPTGSTLSRVSVSAFITANRQFARHWIVSLLCFLSGSSTLFAQPQAGDYVKRQYNFREYTVFDGLPQGQSLTIAQDNNGYIWTGTYAGLTRYNGHEFKTYSIRDGLPNNTVRSIVQMRDGRLAFGTADGLCFWSPQNIECVQQGARLVSSNIMRMIEDRHGSLWIASDGGVTHYQPAGSVHYTVSNRLPDSAIRAVAMDAAERLWVGASGGVFRLKDDVFSPIAETHFANKSVRALLSTDRGMWVGTTTGLYLLREDRLVPLEMPATLKESAVLSLYQDSQKALWIGTYNGVFRYHDNRFEKLSPQPGLPAIATYSIFEDREGNVWMGTDQGISKHVPGPFISYTERQGMSHSFVRAMTIDEAGQIWMGTRNGVTIFDYQHETFIDKRADFPMKSSRVFALQSLPGNQMLIGTQENLCWVQNGKITRQFDTSDGLPSDYVSALHIDHQQRVWIGTARGLAEWRNGEVIAQVSMDYPITSIYAMKSDEQGRLWIGTGNLGILIFDVAKNRWQQLDDIPALTKDTIWSMDQDRHGNFWIGTNGLGLYQVDQQFALRKKFDTTNGLVNDYVWQVKVDSNGRVWAYTNHGLSRIDGDMLQHFDGTDGLVDLEGAANAIIEHANGDLWFGTGQGVIRYSPRHDGRLITDTPIIIERVSSRQRPVQANAQLAHDASTLTFEFASPRFRDERDIRFQYRLLGASDQWSESTSSWQVTYPTLAPGKYEFQVVASDQNGQWSATPATFVFSVATPYWRSWPFMLLYLALSGVMIYGLIRWRVRRLQRAHDRLEREIEDRTLQLKASNAELNRLAATDHLTKLYNRRHLMRMLHQEVLRLNRQPGNACLGLLLIDVDHFKSVNDTYGHTIGDEVLIELANRLTQLARATDLVARFGGEEFALLLPLTDQEGCAHVAHKLLESMRASSFNTSAGTELNITVSIGYALLCTQSDQQTMPHYEALIKAADHALYQAKNAGRNCARRGELS